MTPAGCPSSDAAAGPQEESRVLTRLGSLVCAVRTIRILSSRRGGWQRVTSAVRSSWNASCLARVLNKWQQLSSSSSPSSRSLFSYFKERVISNNAKYSPPVNRSQARRAPSSFKRVDPSALLIRVFICSFF